MRIIEPRHQGGIKSRDLDRIGAGLDAGVIDEIAQNVGIDVHPLTVLLGRAVQREVAVAARVAKCVLGDLVGREIDCLLQVESIGRGIFPKSEICDRDRWSAVRRTGNPAQRIHDVQIGCFCRGVGLTRRAVPKYIGLGKIGGVSRVDLLTLCVEQVVPLEGGQRRAAIEGEEGGLAVASVRGVQRSGGGVAEQIHRAPAILVVSEAADTAHDAFGDLVLGRVDDILPEGPLEAGVQRDGAVDGRRRAAQPQHARVGFRQGKIRGAGRTGGWQKPSRSLGISIGACPVRCLERRSQLSIGDVDPRAGLIGLHVAVGSVSLEAEVEIERNGVDPLAPDGVLGGDNAVDVGLGAR